MNARRMLGWAYRRCDALLLARLPPATQRKIVTRLLHIARNVFPSASWPASADGLLARRSVLGAPAGRRSLPDWALADMADLARQVDPLLSPEAFLAARPRALLTPVHWSQAGHAYRRILKRIGTERFDTVLLVPWLRRGGADLAALHHARVCREEFGQRVLVIGTECSASTWAERLGNQVPFIDIGPELASLSAAGHEPEIVLARLLIQLAPGRVHLINSHTGWRTLERFGKAIGQRTEVFVSLYCDEISPAGVREGLAQRFLPTTWQWLDGVISDNTASPIGWHQSLGVDPDLFRVVHLPAPPRRARHSVPGPSPGNRVLWASRLERQKRPELLVALASQTPDIEWDIHGAPLDGRDRCLAALSRLKNVHLHGSYEDFAAIVRPEHLAFVYTTAWDGLPNVLLEAATADLPIVAPDIGGIRDLLPPEHLLPGDAAVAEYAQAIRALADPGVRHARLAIQDAQLRSFTAERFSAAMRQVYGLSAD